MHYDSPQTWYRRGLEALEGELPRTQEQLVRAAQTRADDLVARSPEVAVRACGAGCTACCHFRVGVTAAEALHLHGVLRAHPESTRLRMQIETRAAEADAEPETPSGRRAPRRPCALLDPAGHCSVYADRPLACRGWNSTDREGCEMEHRGLGGTPRPDGAAYHAVLGVAQALESCSTALDDTVPAGHYELHDALRRLFAGRGDPVALEEARRPPSDGSGQGN